MSSIETTELKLKTTPTGGMEAHTSPYYRRLLSAGYKGFLQGTIGGATLYGTMGLIVGTLVSVPILFITAGFGGLAIIPIAGAVGMLKGASTFGNIGSVAAINAESAELSEQRRYLLDRYYDLPEGLAGDHEAEVIKQELYKRQTDSQKPEHFLHWKTVAIGAGIGALLAIGLITFAPELLAGSKLAAFLVETIHIALPEATVSALSALTTTTIGSLITAAGALAGATIGIDRYYIRKWFDHTQDVVHASSHNEGALMARDRTVERIKEANKEDQKTQQRMDVSENSSSAADIANAAIAKAQESSAATVSNAAPATNVQASSISRETLERRAEALKGIEI